MTYAQASEIICGWMEPDAPPNGGVPGAEVLNEFSPKGWWRYNGLACNWKLPILVACQHQRELFGYLWQVEERLSDEQWVEYIKYFTKPLWFAKALLHATVEQKAIALAKVIQETKAEKA